MPIVGILIGGLDFTVLKIQVGTATITYGNLIIKCCGLFDCCGMHLCNVEVFGAF